MEQIVIQIKNKKKAQALIDFLKSLDFIEDVNITGSSAKNASGMNEKEFFALAGIWAERVISLDSIRSNAWPTHS